MKQIICVIGLPGSGKTTFADMLGARDNACRINADVVRATINRDLGFSEAERIEQARRMAHLANLVLATGKNDMVIVDFVCPTPATRQAFLTNCQFETKMIWMNTITREQSRFADTNNTCGDHTNGKRGIAKDRRGAKSTSTPEPGSMRIRL